MDARFTVGEKEKTTIEVHMNGYGREIYTVNGVEVARRIRWSSRSTVDFTVGTDERHHVRVEMNVFPPVSRVYVDDVLFLDPLFFDGTASTEPLDSQTTARLFSQIVHAVFRWLRIALVASVATATVAWHWPRDPGAEPTVFLIAMAAGLGGLAGPGVVGTIRRWRARGNPRNTSHSDVD